MKSFKSFLLTQEETFVFEALDPNNYKERQTKTAELFLGRMQPVHLGHKAIIDKMKNPVVVLVKGAKSSQDKTKNPFDAKDQERFLKKIVKGVRVEIAPNGYIPDIINQLRKDGIEITTVYAGADRIKGYQGQINSFNKQMPEEKQVKVKIKETPRVTSATTVRNALKDDDIETFKKNMPKELHSEYEYMKKKVK